MAGRLSIRELSRQLGYSPSTVSNALNHKGGVGRETAERIISAARELGYERPSRLASVTFVIARKSGRMVDEGSFRLAVINGIEHEASRRGLKTSYATLELGDETDRARRVSELMSDPTTGIVLLGTEMGEDDFALFADWRDRIVVVDGTSERLFFESVVFSNEGSAYNAVRYLIERGHTRIGYIAGSLRIRNFPLRERGWRSALAEAGLPVREDWRVELGTERLESAYLDMRAWLAGSPELPTAFFADDDALAVGAMRALMEAGHDVPGDVSVIGFDDVDYAAIAHPPLTTVHVPRFDIGRIAVQKLVAQAENPLPYTCVTHLSTALVERESVRALG